MKFSDMIGPDDETTAPDAALTTDAGAPPLPPLVDGALALPETPVRFGGTRSALDDAVADVAGMTEPEAEIGMAEASSTFGPAPDVPPLPPLPPLPTAPAAVAPVAELADAPAPEAPTEERTTAADDGEEPAATANDTPDDAPDDVPDRPAVEPGRRTLAASAFATLGTPSAAEPAAPPDADDEAGPSELLDVAHELASRGESFDELTGTSERRDATDWLQGLGSIDDDLLPR